MTSLMAWRTVFIFFDEMATRLATLKSWFLVIKGLVLGRVALNLLILGMIDLTSHDGNNLWDVEGQVPDDSKNNNITKEDDGDDKSSTRLEMTVEIVGVSGVIMTTFNTLIDANFLFLLWLLIWQFVTSKIAPLNWSTSMNLRTFLYSLCLLEKAGIDTEKSNFISDRLVHVFLLIMPILGSNSLKDLRAFGAFESLLLTVLEGREPLLAGELLPHVEQWNFSMWTLAWARRCDLSCVL